MKITAYKCDRCGDTITEADVVFVSLDYTKGRFDLRNEKIELCPGCALAFVKDWVQVK